MFLCLISKPLNGHYRKKPLKHGQRESPGRTSGEREREINYLLNELFKREVLLLIELRGIGRKKEFVGISEKEIVVSLFDLDDHFREGLWRLLAKMFENPEDLGIGSIFLEHVIIPGSAFNKVPLDFPLLVVDDLGPNVQQKLLELKIFDQKKPRELTLLPQHHSVFPAPDEELTELLVSTVSFKKAPIEL